MAPGVRPAGRAAGRQSAGSDDLVDADVAARAAGPVDSVQGVPGGLDALPGLPYQRLVVRLIGAQRAIRRLVHEPLDVQRDPTPRLCASESKIDSTKPTSGYAVSMVRDLVAPVNRLVQGRRVRCIGV